MRPLFLLLLAVATAAAERVDVQIDPASTQIRWTLGDVLHTVHGTFRLQKGDVWFDPATGNAGGLLVVAAASGESGNTARDSRMQKNVLESARYPEITFAPDHIEGSLAPSGDSQVQIHGQFTIHGNAHEMVMTVKAHADEQKITASMSFRLPYVKWGMKDPSTFVLKVKDYVDIDVQSDLRIRPRT
jgi:polyisoprenoid-binding protein YceI